LSIVEKVNTWNVRAVQSVLCERAKIFLDRLGQDDGEVRAKIVSREIEVFSSRLMEMLVSPIVSEAESEAARMERAILALAYGNSAASSETGRLTTTLEQWLAKERSGPVRETITRALRAFGKVDDER
jgi:hypothetical protein